MTHGSKRTARITASLGLAALAGSWLSATPTFADPSIETVQAQVESLYHQAEQASERYDTAREQLTKARVRVAAVRADLARERRQVETVRQQVAAGVVAQYQGQSLSSMKVFLTDNPQSFLDQLTTVSQFQDQQSQTMATYAVQAKQLELRQAAARRAVAEISATKRRMAADKARIDEKAAKAKALLSTLKSKAAAAAAARAAEASRSTASRSTSTPSTPAPVANVPVSGRAGAAVQYAMAQVGKAYVYGAAGPNAFDCSGLTMMAWRAAGVSLPHSSSAQQGYGTPVSESQLRPGDLVFYYSPVSHVGMYIGNGKIVNAENPSVGIVVAPLHLMPYAGAVRPG